MHNKSITAKITISFLRKIFLPELGSADEDKDDKANNK